MVFFIFIQILIEHSASKQLTRSRFAASDLGLHCLPLSHKKDAMLIWVNSSAADRDYISSALNRLPVLLKCICSK